MKMTLFLKVLFLFLTGSLQAQNVIYSEDFNDDIGKGVDGGELNDLVGVDWTLDVSDCSFSGSGDYAKVVSIGTSRFEVVDSDGEVVWMSPFIDISNCTNIGLSLLVAETGSGTNEDKKYVKLYYILDGSEEVSFFESTLNWTNCTADVSGLNGTSLQLVARMKTTYSSDKIYIDDIVVSGTSKVVSNDALTQVLKPSNQVLSQNISSLINNEILAQTLLKFRLLESQSSDKLDTKIKSIKFKNIVSDKAVNLPNQFEDFIIYDGGNFIPVSSIDISLDEVILNFVEGDFLLADNSSCEYELRGYLKSSGIIDGEKLILSLEAGALGFTTYDSGSSFDSSNSFAVISPEHELSVLGTNLHFKSVPIYSLIKNADFSVVLESRDIYGNLDLDATEIVELSLEDGGGVLSGVLVNHFSLGQVVFDGLSYSLAETLKIKATAAGYITVVSAPISVVGSQSTDVSLSDWIPITLNLSSLLNDENEALEVFRFVVNDKGDDAESTFLNRLSLLPALNNSMNWEEHIAGFLIKEKGLVLDAEYVFDSTGLIIDILEKEVLREVFDGESKEFSVYVYLKEEVIDGEVFQMKIDDSHLFWSTQGTGLVPSFQGELSGESFLIDVQGTHLHLISIPEADVEFASNFEVVVNLTDGHGNIDLGANQIVSLSLAEGKGDLLGILTDHLVLGELKFRDLSYNYSEAIKLIISGEGLESETSGLIHVLASKSTNVKVQDWEPDDLFVSSLLTSENDFKEVFRFEISDIGEDGIATELKVIRLIAGDENTVNWNSGIADFQLKINNEVANVTFQADKASLLIKFSEIEGLTRIEDGESIDLSLWVYLPTKCFDGAIFQAVIENKHTLWEVYGTHLREEFVGNMKGHKFAVDVEGTELSFKTKLLKIINPNVDFGMSLKMTDIYKNIDQDSEKEARVSLFSGTGKLSSNKGLATYMVNGGFLWTDLRYDKAENFTLLIETSCGQSIVSSNLSSLDVNSNILEASVPIKSRKMSSLAINMEDSEVVLNFSIKDEGIVDDSPTRINSMKFFNVIGVSSFDWKKHLAGAVLLRDGEIFAKTTKVDDAFISFTSLNFEVENGGQTDIELAIFFKKSLLPDHARFQVEIRKEHDWKSSTTGSLLRDVLSENIQSDIHEIEVDCDRFDFISYPTGVEESTFFDIKIAAVDEFYNIDRDYTADVSLDASKGVLSQVESLGKLKEGCLEVKGLSFLGDQVLELIASDSLYSITKEIYVQERNDILLADFESLDLSSWENVGDWVVSSYKPIEGVNSLKHNLSNAVGSSYIVHPLNNIQIGAESIYWEFILQNADWDPSGSNNFGFNLLMNSNDPKRADILYSVGVNLSGTDDKLGMWKTEGGRSYLIMTSDSDWNENETVAIKVVYDSKGKWQFYYNRLGDKNNWLKAGTVFSEVISDSTVWYSGVQFNFATASCSGKLSLDGLNVKIYNTAPFLKKLDVFADSLRLNFSESLNLESLLNVGNYELKLAEELIEIVNVESRYDKQAVLLFDRKLLSGRYYLSVRNIEDINGVSSNLETFEFSFQEEAQLYDLIINEILSNESPVVGLPEYEFIEIYNAGNHPINIQNFRLRVGKSEKILGEFELLANEYLILCSTTASNFYKEFGNTLEVVGFPSLLNVGACISIESSTGVLLDEINYSPNWYVDDLKKSGGWSLERIDVNNHSWQPENWAASTDELGGTPGRVNSVEALNPDLSIPYLLYFELNGLNTIDLFFSESLDLNHALTNQNYSLNKDLVSPVLIELLDDEIFALRLSFLYDFKNNLQYQLILSNQLVDLAGNSIGEVEIDFLLAEIPQLGDLIINEVLFNPYPNGSDYVELLNISDRKIDIKDLFIANRDENYQLDAIYKVNEKSQMLEAGAYLLLTNDTANIKETYAHHDERTFVEMKNLPSFNDDKGRVVVLNRNNDELDDFAYNDKMHFRLLTVKDGVSLERVNPNKVTNLNSNWVSASQVVGFGTPGLQNSSYDINEVEVNEIGFKSKVFSPDNDGVDDRLVINFKLEKSGYVANIRIYNRSGVEVRRLASNLTLSTTDELFWDGLLSNKIRASIGIYVFYFELFHPDGDVKTYKKTCVLAGKFK